MEWAKTRPAAEFDLAGSNILACSLDDLPGARETLALDGANDKGYQPLTEAIARRHPVRGSAGRARDAGARWSQRQGLPAADGGDRAALRRGRGSPPSAAGSPCRW